MTKPEASPITLMQLPMDNLFTVVTIGHVSYTSPWCHFPRRAEEYILYCVESGDLYIEEDGVRWHAGKNTALLLEPGKLHVGYQAATVSYYFIHFTSPKPLEAGIMTDAIREHIIRFHRESLNATFTYQWFPGPNDSAPLYFPKLATLGSSFQYFESLYMATQNFFEGFEGRRTLVALRLQEVLIMLSREFSQACVSPNSTKALILVRDIQRYLEEHFTADVSSQDISLLFHTSYDYANRLFKKHIGQSIHSYLISIRIRKAKQLLSAGMSVGDAASQVGIEDIAYFSRLFKKHTGQSPSAFSGGGSDSDWER